ncbi:hypothetical protein RRG08_045011 [Elysia crispata]|uniref:Uncharacterized protein n=1 Tax=Elysia crispata TaxID=231223 RepID=A0AAE0Y3M8_9GAST|nr:hypothetical protein RRG08_045011 [Elysia crispata]
MQCASPGVNFPEILYNLVAKFKARHRVEGVQSLWHHLNWCWSIAIRVRDSLLGLEKLIRQCGREELGGRSVKVCKPASQTLYTGHSFGSLSCGLCVTDHSLSQLLVSLTGQHPQFTISVHRCEDGDGLSLTVVSRNAFRIQSTSSQLYFGVRISIVVLVQAEFSLWFINHYSTGTQLSRLFPLALFSPVTQKSFPLNWSKSVAVQAVDSSKHFISHGAVLHPRNVRVDRGDTGRGIKTEECVREGGDYVST